MLRHRTVVDKNAPKPAPDEPSAEHGALALIERSAVIAALRTLPDRHVAHTPGQHFYPATEPEHQLSGRQDLQPGRGQLDRQRQALKAAADLHYGQRVVLGQGEPGAHRAGPVQEQRHRR